MKSCLRETFKTKSEWKEKHTKFLGGSSASVIYGASNWKNILELYNDITNPKNDENEVTNENIELGIASEPLIRKTFALNFPNYKVRNPKGWESYLNKKHPFLGATVDGLLTDTTTGDLGVLEIKTCDIRRKCDWEEWDNKIPDKYYCQILHYLMVIEEAKFVKVVAQLRMFDWSSELDNKVVELRTIVRHIERSEVEKDIDKLRELEISFWNNNVVPHVPPTYTRKIGE